MARLKDIQVTYSIADPNHPDGHRELTPEEWDDWLTRAAREAMRLSLWSEANQLSDGQWSDEESMRGRSKLGDQTPSVEAWHEYLRRLHPEFFRREVEVPEEPPQPEPEPPAVVALSPRQAEVLDLISQGVGYEEIAERLDITGDTVKSHMKAIFRKLGADNSPHAVRLAYERGLLPRRGTRPAR